MENKVIKDAVRLATNILNSLLPSDSWAIVNIVKDERDHLLFNDFPDIPTTFGYIYDQVITLLTEEGIIEESNPGSWFIGITDTDSYYAHHILPYIEQLDGLGMEARSKGYLTEKQLVEYYYSNDRQKLGPVISGHYSVLINRNRLDKFIKKFSNLLPNINEETGEFSFRGEVVLFKGELEIKSLKLLLNNLNSLVSKKEFYLVRGKNDYEQIKDRYGVTQLHDSLEKMFNVIKKRLKQNSKLKDVFVFTQDNGFGIFINEKALRS